MQTSHRYAGPHLAGSIRYRTDGWPRVARRGLWCGVCLVAAAATLAVRAAEPVKVEMNVELNVVTFNVLVDFSRPAGIPAWKDRRDLCITMLRQSGATLIGLQEPSPGQLRFFREQLADFDEVHFQEGRKEYTDAALFFHRDTFAEKERGHWWLSPTPERVSTGFGNTLPRLVVWARLAHRASGRELYVFNTHFDNTMPSQVKMAALCAEKFASFTNSGLPMVFMGDFNTDQERGDYAKLTSGGWRDAYGAAGQASADGRDDRVGTFEGGRRIDHIFYFGPALEAVGWQRLESPDPTQRLSDHYAVQARLRWH